MCTEIRGVWNDVHLYNGAPVKGETLYGAQLNGAPFDSAPFDGALYIMARYTRGDIRTTVQSDVPARGEYGPTTCERRYVRWAPAPI